MAQATPAMLPVLTRVPRARLVGWGGVSRARPARCTAVSSESNRQGITIVFVFLIPARVPLRVSLRRSEQGKVRGLPGNEIKMRWLLEVEGHRAFHFDSAQ
jgi:hypothetical protein